jgi:hypothetical protein
MGQRHMRVAVDEPGHDEMAAAVNALVTVEVDTDIDDPVPVDDDIGDTCPAGARIENGTAAQQGSRHVPQHRTTPPTRATGDSADGSLGAGPGFTSRSGARPGLP